MKHQSLPTDGSKCLETGIIHILVVTGYGVTGPGAVHANPVGTASYRRRLHQAVPLVMLQTAEQGERLFALGTHLHTPLTVRHFIAKKWLIYAADTRRPGARHQRVIMFTNAFVP